MGDFTTDAYLTPLINQVYGDQVTQLMSDTGSAFDEQVRDVPAIPIGTTSLANYQAEQMANDSGGPTTNGPLFGLFSPICVEWKQAGQPDMWYVEAARTGKLPNVSPAAPFAPFLMQWEWRGNIIFLTPLMYVSDLRVRGQFSLPPLVKDTDVLQVHPRMLEATAYGTAALIGQERSNANYTENYSRKADEVLIEIENILIKAEQGTTTRIGRLGGQSGSGYGNGGSYA